MKIINSSGEEITDPSGFLLHERIEMISRKIREVPVPSTSDCWICQIETWDASHSIEHIVNHINDQKLNGHLVATAWEWYAADGNPLGVGDDFEMYEPVPGPWFTSASGKRLGRAEPRSNIDYFDLRLAVKTYLLERIKEEL